MEPYPGRVAPRMGGAYLRQRLDGEMSSLRMLAWTVLPMLCLAAWPVASLSQDSSEPPPGDGSAEPVDPNTPSEREEVLLRLAVENARKAIRA